MILERQAEVQRRVSALGKTAKVAFATVCAQRLAPVHSRHVAMESDDPFVEDLLELLWSFLCEGSEADPVTMRELYDDGKENLPDSDEFQEYRFYVVLYSCVSALSAIAELAGFSVHEFMPGKDKSPPVEAAMALIEAIALYVRREAGIEWSEYQSFVDTLANHPRYKEEIARQDRDLSALRRWDEEGCPAQPDFMNHLRLQAESEALVFLADDLS